MGLLAVTAGSESDNHREPVWGRLTRASPGLARVLPGSNRQRRDRHHACLPAQLTDRRLRQDPIHGTFAFRRNLIKTGQGYGYGPGGAEVETAADGSTWIAYQVWKDSKPTPTTPGKRILRTAKLDWVKGLPVFR
ncbi:hypothetical protein V6K52_13955 [Knoellia sp. S7-12]|uniref:hypothetical protein n=1 Tax=Knoellia sp. S7-12 TaxID=3126698 RepID=UPI003367551F